MKVFSTKLLFGIFLSFFIIRPVFSQTYTTSGLSTNWNDAVAWVKFKNFTFVLLVLMLTFYSGASIAQNCTVCDHTIGATGGPSPAIPNNSNGITVCINANRTAAINFNNAQNVTVCISSNVTVSAAFNSLSSLSQLNNFGTFTALADYNGNWTLNNSGTLTVNFGSLNSI